MFVKIKTIIESSLFHNFIIGVIVLNGIVMGFETSKEFLLLYGNYAEWFNVVVIVIFTIEIILRIYIYRKAFFKDAWSLFDLFIVLISLVPASAGFEIFRIMRVLRLLRLITVVPQMKKIVLALVKVIPGMSAIGGLLLLIFYIFAIMATNLYSETFPVWFGTLGDSLYTLFQIMTLESWSMGIVRPMMEVHPNAWIFFVLYILIATFIMINLIVAVVVDAMNELTSEESSSVTNKTIEEEHLLEVKRLRVEIQELKEMIVERKI
ncbi:MAG: ion transporter [Campylobacterota bacterium]|nr:ion transporter [Campylobacterota bacterium]